MRGFARDGYGRLEASEAGEEGTLELAYLNFLLLSLYCVCCFRLLLLFVFLILVVDELSL